MQCPKCGANNNAGVVNCAYCGNQLASGSSAVPPPTPRLSSDPPRWSANQTLPKKSPVGLIVVLLLAGLVVGWFVFKGKAKNPEGVTGSSAPATVTETSPGSVSAVPSSTPTSSAPLSQTKSVPEDKPLPKHEGKSAADEASGILDSARGGGGKLPSSPSTEQSDLLKGMGGR